MTLFGRLKLCIYLVYKSAKNSHHRQWAGAWINGFDRSEEGAQTVMATNRSAASLAAQAVTFLCRAQEDPKNQSSYEKAANLVLDTAFQILETDFPKWRDFQDEVVFYPDTCDPSVKKIYRPYINKKRRAISTKEYAQMLHAQGDKCDVCKRHWTVCPQPKKKGQPRKFGLLVDHDHQTGEIRGLLCDNCNKKVGHVNESFLMLRSIENYLRKHKPNFENT